MPSPTATITAWIDQQQDRLLETVVGWSHIGSHSLDLVGLDRMRDSVATAFASLGAARRIPVAPLVSITADGREVSTPLGDTLAIRGGATRRPDALRVLLAIHLDTVYPSNGDAAEPVVALDNGGTILRGPGVTDAKGGLAVMLVALEAVERAGLTERLAWEVLVNADEELGSPGSAGLLMEAAGRHDLGLLFEPALDPAGTLAAPRKGSGNFQLVVRGRSAHAGRRFAEGRNAVVAAARLATVLAALNDEATAAGRDLTVNVAALRGGAAFNVVPDLAIVDVNVRAATPADAAWTTSRLAAIATAAADGDGLTATLHGGFHSPPKPLDLSTQLLLDHAATCGAELGLAIAAAATGGACDGNRLAAAGLPNLDSLGVRGGGIHSPEEYLLVESLAERAKLTALLLAGLADGSLAWPRRDAAGGREAWPCS
jgi:glutamate carboxypeptidase